MRSSFITNVLALALFASPLVAGSFVGGGASLEAREPLPHHTEAQIAGTLTFFRIFHLLMGVQRVGGALGNFVLALASLWLEASLSLGALDREHFVSVTVLTGK